MSYANGTTHYNLPQTVGTDKRDWSDTNQAFADLDAAVYAANNDLSGVTDRVTALEGDNTENKTKISDNATSITTLDGRVTAVEHVANDASNGLADVRQDAEDMIASYNETSATSKHDYEVGQFFIYNDVLYKATQKISAGNTIIPNTNCEATNVTTAFGKHVIVLNHTGTTYKAAFHEFYVTINRIVKGHETNYANAVILETDSNGTVANVYHPSYYEEDFLINFNNMTMPATDNRLRLNEIAFGAKDKYCVYEFIDFPLDTAAYTYTNISDQNVGDSTWYFIY